MKPTMGVGLVIALTTSLHAGDFPRMPAAVNDILYARHFELSESYRSYWHSNHRDVESGFIVVVSVDPDYRAICDAGMPVLLTDDSTVETFNSGASTGKVIGIVPELDSLSGLRMWFADFGSPDQVDADLLQIGSLEATEKGIGSLSPASIAAALAAGGAPLTLEDRAELLHEIASVVETYDVE